MDALMRRRMMMLAGSGPTPPTPVVPAGYTQLVYIEQPLGNSAYINTGISSGANIGFVIDAMSYDEKATSGYGCFFGARYNSNSSDLQLTTFSSSGSYAGTLRRGGSSQNYNAHLPAKNTRFTASLVGNTYSIGADTVTTSASMSRAYNIYLFALNNRNSVAQHGHFRLYSLKITNNGVDVRDFIPCIDPNNVVGLYDLVSGTFFSSENATTFVAGPTIN